MLDSWPAAQTAGSEEGFGRARHPVLVYLADLAPSARSQRSGLERLAASLSGDHLDVLRLP